MNELMRDKRTSPKSPSVAQPGAVPYLAGCCAGFLKLTNKNLSYKILVIFKL
jgi:hypothetical protein